MTDPQQSSLGKAELTLHSVKRALPHPLAEAPHSPFLSSVSAVATSPSLSPACKSQTLASILSTNLPIFETQTLRASIPTNSTTLSLNLAAFHLQHCRIPSNPKKIGKQEPRKEITTLRSKPHRTRNHVPGHTQSLDLQKELKRFANSQSHHRRRGNRVTDCDFRGGMRCDGPMEVDLGRSSRKEEEMLVRDSQGETLGFASW